MIYFRGWWKQWQGIRIEIDAPRRTQHAEFYAQRGVYNVHIL